MKIGFLTQYYPPEIGAPQARLSELARRLVEQGHEVHVLTAMPNYPRGKIYEGYGGLFRQEEQQGVHILRTYVYPTKSTAMAVRLTNYFSFVGSSLIAGSAMLPQLDYLLTESPPLFLGLSGYVLSRLKGARWVFNVSDLWPESAVNLGVVRPGFALRAAEALEAFCYRKAWLVSGQSREILHSINERFPETHTYHLSNGVDANLFRPDLRGEATRHMLAGCDAACVVLYAGLHGIAQGLDQVLRAAAELRDDPEIVFVFIGDGPEKEQLVAMSRSMGLQNVRFLPPVPREQMPEIVASADVALVTLKHHIPGAVPSKIYEAMGAGLPLLLVAQGEAAQIVGDTQAGEIVAPNDLAGLVDALQRLASDSSRRRVLGAAGRRAAEQKYNRQGIADAFATYLLAAQ